MKIRPTLLLTSAAVFTLAVASIALAQTSAPDVPTFPRGTETVTIPYTRTVDFNHVQSLHVRMSINGSEPQGFEVDTGSVGIVIGATSIPHFDGKGTPDEITYSSSGRREIGVRTTVEITFPDVKMPDGRPVVAHVPVLAVTDMKCIPGAVNACQPSTGTPNPHMLGIGFGRGTAANFDAQIKNVFVQLDDMVHGRMRRGYIISPKGIQLGLNAETIGSGWVWQKLQPRDAKVPDDYNGPKDYETAPGTFAVAGKAIPMGTVLIDTGLTNMMLETPGAPQDGDLPPGTAITMYLLGGRLNYSFAVNDQANPLTPRKVSWRHATHGTYVNTGLHALAKYDYCFDSDGGYLGLRVRQ